jgi:hypothetical protein
MGLDKVECLVYFKSMLNNPYNLYNLKANFNFYLKKQKIAEISRKNYLSDFNHFLKWLGGRSFNRKTVRDYQNFLLSQKTSFKTAQRRFSTLRKFGEFLVFQKFLPENPVRNFSYQPPKSKGILGQFENFLKREKRSPLTIKNYLSDIRQFLTNQEKADKSSPSTIKRKLASRRRFCQWATMAGYLRENPFVKKPARRFPVKKLACLLLGGLLATSFALAFYYRQFLIQSLTRFLPQKEVVVKEVVVIREVPVLGETAPTPAPFSRILPKIIPPTDNLALESRESSATLGDRFRIDASDSAYLGGNLNFTTSAAKITAGGTDILLVEPNSLTILGLTRDGGLGIFGTTGAILPANFDFTKNVTIEFDFQTGTKNAEVKFNQNKSGDKYYLASWAESGQVSLQKCRPASPTCSVLKSETIDFEPNSWHHGRISLAFGGLTFEIDFKKVRLEAPVAVDLPAQNQGSIQFSPNFAALANLRISPNNSPVLTSGNAKIGDNLIVGSDLKIEGNALITGSLGLGTANPGTKLAVAGLTGSSSYSLVRVDTTTGNFYYDASSEKYKEDTQPLTDDFSKILAVQPQSFKDKTSGQQEIGLIAETLAALGLNNLVIYKDGQPEAVKYEKIPLYLLAVIKDQQKRLDELVNQLGTQQEIVSPVKPARFGDLIVDLDRGNPSTQDGFGKLLVKGVDNEVVASIDALGNATFSGRVTVNELESERVASDELISNTATITGTLYAQKIESEEISAMTGKFGEILEASSSALLAEVDAFVKELLQAQVASVSADLKITDNITVNSEQLTVSSKFAALGSASLADTTIAGNLLVDGTLSLSANSIASLGPLYLSSPEGIDLMAGKVVINKEGNVMIENNLAVKGSLFANLFKPLPGHDLTVDLASAETGKISDCTEEEKILYPDLCQRGNPSETKVTSDGGPPIRRDSSEVDGFGKLLVKGIGGETVASIDASGNTQFAGDLTASGSGTFNKIIIASANPTSSSHLPGDVPPAAHLEGETSSNATAGTAILPAGETEMLIANNSITDNSLVYLTPLSSTENKVLYVKAKKSPTSCLADQLSSCQAEKGWFKVALDSPIEHDIQFNWWVIN